MSKYNIAQHCVKCRDVKPHIATQEGLECSCGYKSKYEKCTGSKT
jgi:hypothetical protein